MTSPFIARWYYRRNLIKEEPVCLSGWSGELPYPLAGAVCPLVGWLAEWVYLWDWLEVPVYLSMGQPVCLSGWSGVQAYLWVAQMVYLSGRSGVLAYLTGWLAVFVYSSAGLYTLPSVAWYPGIHR